MEKIAFIEFMLVASLGLLLFGSKLTMFTQKFNRKNGGTGNEAAGLSTRPSHR